MFPFTVGETSNFFRKIDFFPFYKMKCIFNFLLAAYYVKFFGRPTVVIHVRGWPRSRPLSCRRCRLVCGREAGLHDHCAFCRCRSAQRCFPAEPTCQNHFTELCLRPPGYSKQQRDSWTRSRWKTQRQLWISSSGTRRRAADARFFVGSLEGVGRATSLKSFHGQK